MIQLMPFPIMFSSGGGGSRSRPHTSGPVILAVVAGLTAALLGGICYAVAGLLGLLIIPGLTVLLAWCLMWGWLGVQCLDHSSNSHGIAAGVYVIGYGLCFTVGIVSLIGLPMLLADHWLGW